MDVDEVIDELEHSSHFHIAVVSKHIDGGHVTRAIREETGWLVARSTKGDSSVSIYNKYDLARFVTHRLSHTGVAEMNDGSHRAADRYFGRTANLAATDEVEAEMDDAPDGICAGRLLDIEKVSRFLEDEESMKNGPHSDDPRETWRDKVTATDRRPIDGSTTATRSRITMSSPSGKG